MVFDHKILGNILDFSNCHDINSNIFYLKKKNIFFQTDSPTDIRPDINKHKKKPVTTRSEQEYNLTAVVVCVEDNPKNLVSYVRIPDKKDEIRWFLFNDMR